MKSRKKYTLFNIPMFFDAAKQLRLICLVCFGILTLFTVLIPVGKTIDLMNYDGEFALPVIASVKTSFIYMYLIFMVFAPLITIYLFSFLTKRSTCDYYHAFPHTRGCIFTTYFAVIAAWLFVMTFGTAILSSIVYMCVSSYVTLSFVTLLEVSVSVYVASLLVAASILFACQITGTLFTNVIVSGLVIFLPRFLLSISISIISSFSELFVNGKLLPLLDDKYNIVFDSVSSIITDFEIISMTSLPAVVYTLILTAVFFFVGRMLFIKRRSEVAGSPSVNRVLQCVIRIAIAIPVCIIPISNLYGYFVCGNILSTTDVFSFIVAYIVAIFIMLIYELISTRKFSNVIKALPSIGILAIINVVILGGLAAIYNVEVNYTPSEDEIKYIRLAETEYDADYFQKKMGSYDITDKDIIKMISEKLAETVEMEKSNSFNYVTEENNYMAVAIKSGLTLKYRRIVFSQSESTELSETLMQCEDIKKIYTELPEYNKNTLSLDGSFSAEQKEDLYNTLREEVKSIDYSVWYDSIYNNDGALALQMNTVVDDNSVYSLLPLNSNTPKTLLKYMNYLNADYAEETLDTDLECLNEMLVSKNESDDLIQIQGGDEYYDMSISIYSDDYSSMENSIYYGTSSEDVRHLPEIIESIKKNYTGSIDSLEKEGKKLATISMCIYKPQDDRYSDYKEISFATYIDSDVVDNYLEDYN